MDEDVTANDIELAEKLEARTKNVNTRGRLPSDVEAYIRKTRVAEQWERYDSVVIGPGANAIDDGWFNTWADFALADELTWFTKRNGGVGASFTNQKTERLDYAQDIFQTGIEFIAPPGLGDRESQILDEQIAPLMFSAMLPAQMSFRVKLADADEIALAPGNHFPAGYGVAGGLVDAAAAPVLLPGTNGQAHVSNTWKWPDPVMLPAQGRIAVFARLDNPLRAALAQLSGVGADATPGHKIIPGPNGDILMPNWYVIKVFMRGPRYLQLRGARSAA